MRPPALRLIVTLRNPDVPDEHDEFIDFWERHRLWKQLYDFRAFRNSHPRYGALFEFKNHHGTSLAFSLQRYVRHVVVLYSHIANKS
jgi:hypothetical protein